MNRVAIGIGGILLVIAGGAAWMLWGGSAEEIQRTPIVDTRMHGEAAGAPAMAADEIVVPQLSAAASTGQDRKARVPSP